jgi:hypothetical protein
MDDDPDAFMNTPLNQSGWALRRQGSLDYVMVQWHDEPYSVS